MAQHEIPGHVAFTTGQGGLPKVVITSKASTAEIYLHGAHVTSFQKQGDHPLLFLSGKSSFAAGKAIRGGVPICFPWFGPREGDAGHGFARTNDWEIVKTAVAPDGAVTVQLRLPEIPGRTEWKGLQAEFSVTVSDTLTMELRATNNAAQNFTVEDCLHTYFAISDISNVSLTGLKGHAYIDKVANFARKTETGDTLRIDSEVDRVFPNSTGTIEIHDTQWRRKIRVEKTGSTSTVVWNPWIATSKALTDLGEGAYHSMVCVESGNVGENKLTLAPGKTASLKVVLTSQSV